MSNEELEVKYKELIGECEILTAESVTDVNHSPHPVMIGPKHVKHASDNHGGMLGEATMRACGCSHPGCRLSYDEHTYDKVLFVKLKRDCKPDELTDVLKPISKEFEADGIAGVCFIETHEKFRVVD